MDQSSKQFINNIYFGKMLMPTLTSQQNLDKLDIFLEDEKVANQKDGWSKLDKTIKLKKLEEYTELYAESHQLNEPDKLKLLAFLREALDKKKLSKAKDVNYDKINGTIKGISNLIFHKQAQRFSLRSIDSATRKSKPSAIAECV